MSAKYKTNVSGHGQWRCGEQPIPCPNTHFSSSYPIIPAPHFPPTLLTSPHVERFISEQFSSEAALTLHPPKSDHKAKSHSKPLKVSLQLLKKPSPLFKVQVTHDQYPPAHSHRLLSAPKTLNTNIPQTKISQCLPTQSQCMI